MWGVCLGFVVFLSGPVSGQSFRPIEQANLWYLYLDTGMVVIELNDRYAPKTSARIRELSGAGFYNGKSFYRVIEGFVAQAGANGNSPGMLPLRLEANVKLTARDPLQLVQRPDMFAPITGFWRGFAVGVGQDQRTSWLLHCPGAVGMSRADDPDSATTDFYIVIGQAPRYLDNIMTLFGRVVWGMDKVQQILRAKPESDGMLAAGDPQTKIRWAAVGSALPAEQRIALSVEQTEGEDFEQKLADRRARAHPFFFQKPPAVLDACQVPIAVRRA
ncbi:peptidyl-prolyl cis-trans isomerase, cyclophilin-type [Simiduia agarivorans SA1 = DSM 21679]|uniref:peptidylprolyl isomerase n=2 Tax=Simiduia TaxID=447467 RepID=K4KED0_SIMAS|nr:peptidyl-prolyl cis-trans isomerase, cyclophilin-type [Simiduia agarivorans SA1 = DSM 21679]